MKMFQIFSHFNSSIPYQYLKFILHFQPYFLAKLTSITFLCVPFGLLLSKIKVIFLLGIIIFDIAFAGRLAAFAGRFLV